MTTITLNENLSFHFQTLAQQAHASVDEFVNDILVKYVHDYRREKTVLTDREKNKQLIEKLAGIGSDDVDGSVNYKKHVADYVNEKFSHC
jgi:hypothetical protein